MGREERVRLMSPDKWRVMLSPVRADLTENLRSIGPCSIAEIAAMIGRRPDTLYRHVATLIRAGFVKPAGYRKNGRHVEQLIDATADDFMIDLGRHGDVDEDNEGVAATSVGFLKSAARTIVKASEARMLRLTPHDRNVTVLYEQSRLTPQKFKRVRELLFEAKRIMDECKGSPEGQLYMLVMAASPVPLGSRQRPQNKRAPQRTAGNRGLPQPKAGRAPKRRDLRSGPRAEVAP